MEGHGTLLAPGTIVSTSGVYHVVHDKIDGDAHANPHKVTATHGATLPPCRGCQQGVRYTLHEAAEPVEAHEHFKA